MDNLESSNCLLCLKNGKILINVSNAAYNTSLIEILYQHFWFKSEGSIHSNFICTTCWDVVDNFHKFYDQTMEIHKEFYSKLANQKFHCEFPEANSSINVRNVNVKVEIDEGDNNDFNKAFNNPYANEFEDNCETIEDDDSDQNDDDDDDEDDDGGNTSSDEGSIYLPSEDENPSTPRKRYRKNGPVQIKNDNKEIRKYFNMGCELCDTKFDIFEEAITHYHSIHTTKGYLRCCKRKFRKRSTVLEHLCWHLNPNDYTCKICNQTYPDKRRYKIHQLTHLPVNMKPFKCSSCSESFAKQFLLRQHQAKHDKNKGNQFSCVRCSESFNSKCLLQLHKRKAHEDAFRHVCEICSKAFETVLFHSNHMKNVHNSIDKPPVQCNICQLWMKHESSLRKHLAKHKGTDTHKCDICQKVLASIEALRSHKSYVHTNQRNHKCHLCDKSYKKAIDLREHLAMHDGIMLYKCEHCPRQFNKSSNMLSHKKNMHTKEWEAARQQKILLMSSQSLSAKRKSPKK